MTRWTPDLTTLDRVKQMRKIDTFGDDTLLTQAIHEASVWIAEETDRVFLPYPDTRLYDVPFENDYARNSLDLDDDFLLINTLVNGDGTLIPPAGYVLRPNNAYPKSQINLLNASGYSWQFVTNIQQAISVSGTLGYAENYSRVWKAATTVNGSLSASSTLVAVADARRFAILDYLRVGGEGGELTQVQAVTYAQAPGTLQITRGEQGTTPTAYVPGATVETYAQNASVQNAANLLTLHYYDFRDGYTAQVLNQTLSIADIPQRVVDTVSRFKRRDFSFGEDGS